MLGKKKDKRTKACLLYLWFLTLFAIPGPAVLMAQSSKSGQNPSFIDMRFLTQGKPTFPLVWSPYRPAPIPSVNCRNGPKVSDFTGQGKLAVSLSQFLQLVVENNLVLEASRYNFLIAQVDLLRAKSGQAARGVPSVPVPGALFAGAIGAGVGNTANVSTGGTGGTAISGAARQVTIGPRGAFDPTVSINMSWDRVVSPLNSVKVAGISTVAIPSAVLQTRWQQELPFGTSYALSFNLQRQTTTQAHILYNPAFTSYFSAQIYHPLLNGAGRAFTQRFVSLAENDRRIAYEAFHTDLNNALSAAADAYWDFVALRERQLVAERAFAFAERTYESIKQRIEIGTLAKTDLLTAESQLAAGKLELIIAQTNTQLKEEALKSMITKVVGPEIAAVPFEPTDALTSGIDGNVPPLDDALRSAMRRSSVRQAELGLENQQIAELFTRSNLRPTFSVFAQLNNYTLAPGMGDMFRQLFRYAYPEYSAGFTLTFSIKNRAAQADNVRARLEFQQAKVAFEQTKSAVDLQVRTAITNVTQTRAQVEASQRALAASQRNAEGEQEKWTLGSSTLDDVFQAQLDLARAEAADIQSRVDFAKAVIAEEVATGNLLERHAIDFDEALRGMLWQGTTSIGADK